MHAMEPGSPPTTKREAPDPSSQFVLPHPDRIREAGPDLGRPAQQAPRRTSGVAPRKRERIG